MATNDNGDYDEYRLEPGEEITFMLPRIPGSKPVVEVRCPDCARVHKRCLDAGHHKMVIDCLCGLRMDLSVTIAKMSQPAPRPERVPIWLLLFLLSVFIAALILVIRLRSP